MEAERLEKPDLALAPSVFGAPSAAAVEEYETPCDGSGSAVNHQMGLPEAVGKHEDDDDDASSEEFEFSFSFSVMDSGVFPSVTADELFSGGRILPSYPVFNRDVLRSPSTADEPGAVEEDVVEQIPIRRLLLEDREARSLSSSEQPPVRCKKSPSTGSSLGWRLRDMVVGRSHSDGKEKFVFLEAAPPPAAKKKIPNQNSQAAKASDANRATAHRPIYEKGTNEKSVKGSRRSFLPYRQELLGLFAPVNGLRRTHHPF